MHGEKKDGENFQQRLLMELLSDSLALSWNNAFHFTLCFFFFKCTCMLQHLKARVQGERDRNKEDKSRYQKERD